MSTSLVSLERLFRRDKEFTSGSKRIMSLDCNLWTHLNPQAQLPRTQQEQRRPTA